MAYSFTELTKQTKGIMDAYRKMSGALVESADDDLDEVHQGWRERVQSAHPSKELVFRSKNTGGEKMISAEEKGDPERKCHGLFNMDTKEAQIFHDDIHESADEPLVQSSVKHMGKNYSTYAFKDPDSANKFMSSPAGANYGFLVLDADGTHHVADMDDKGTDAT